MEKASDAKSQHSATPSQIAASEARRHEEKLNEIRKGYVSIIDNDQKKYQPKVVGLNPNMRPDARDSLKKIFPM